MALTDLQPIISLSDLFKPLETDRYRLLNTEAKSRVMLIDVDSQKLENHTHKTFTRCIDSQDMRRRHLLATSAALYGSSVSGCLGGDDRPTHCYDFELELVTDEQIVDQTTISDSGLDDDSTPPLIADLVRQIIRNGSSAIETTESVRRATLEWITHYEQDGMFYKINKSPVEKGDVTGPKYSVDRNEDIPKSVSSKNVIVFEDLPLYDKIRVLGLYTLEDLFDRNVSYSVIAGYLGSDMQSNSILRSSTSSDYIETQMGYLEIKHIGEDTSAAERYEFTSELVAEDPEEFVEYMEQKLQLELSNFRDAEKKLLEEVVAEPSVESCDTDDDESRYAAAQDIASKVRRHESNYQNALVQDGGDWYQIKVRESDISY